MCVCVCLCKTCRVFETVPYNPSNCSCNTNTLAALEKEMENHHAYLHSFRSTFLVFSDMTRLRNSCFLHVMWMVTVYKCYRSSGFCNGLSWQTMFGITSESNIIYPAQQNQQSFVLAEHSSLHFAPVLVPTHTGEWQDC